jgi:hypothetical protein
VREVIAILAEAIARYPQFEPVATGYRHSDELGTTTLTFHVTASTGSDTRVDAVATIETRFTPGPLSDFDDERIAWVNRRAVYGPLFRDTHGIGCRATYPLDKNCPGPAWHAQRLLNALNWQRRAAFASGLIDLSREDYLLSRQVPKLAPHWATRLPSEALEQTAHFLEQRFGILAAVGPTSLVFDVPLTEDIRTGLVPLQAETARISIRTDAQHPIAGVGYCATIVLQRQPPPELLTMWCTRLNALEHQQERFWPRFGAWGKRQLGLLLVYGMFCPTTEADAGDVGILALEMIDRVHWIASDLWAPGIGLQHR